MCCFFPLDYVKGSLAGAHLANQDGSGCIKHISASLHYYRVLVQGIGTIVLLYIP
jgi:hypothetical protein